MTFDDIDEEREELSFNAIELQPIRTDYEPTDLRTKLPSIVTNALDIVPNGLSKDNIGYNYYYVEELKQILMNCNLISSNIELVNDGNNDNILETVFCAFGSIFLDDLETRFYELSI